MMNLWTPQLSTISVRHTLMGWSVTYTLCNSQAFSSTVYIPKLYNKFRTKQGHEVKRGKINQHHLLSDQ